MVVASVYFSSAYFPVRKPRSGRTRQKMLHLSLYSKHSCDVWYENSHVAFAICLLCLRFREHRGMKFRDGKRLEFWSEWKGKKQPDRQDNHEWRRRVEKWILTLQTVTYLTLLGTTWKLNEQALERKLSQSYSMYIIIMQHESILVK